ncbi:MAG: BMP family ABC transporter substrate-binding protein [bacterium]
MQKNLLERYGVLALVATLAASIVTGCGRDTASSAVATIGIAYDIGGRSQPGFNQLAYLGVKPLLDANENLKLVEAQASSSETDDVCAERLRRMADSGVNPIIAVGFRYEAPLTKVAAEFPDVKFGIVDGGTVVASNVKGILFKEEEGSYLVGVAAALKSKTGNIGFIGGVRIPLIQKFEAGYTAGAKAVNARIKVQATYITNLPDSGGFNDPVMGKEVALGMFQNGADVIYSAAGNTGVGVHQAAFEQKKMSIGVDADEYLYESNSAWKSAIITSMLKRVDTGCRKFIDDLLAGTFISGNEVFGYANDGVGYATSGGMIDDIKSRIDEYGAKIASGEITVPSVPEGD